MNILRKKYKNDAITLQWNKKDIVSVIHNRNEYSFPTKKDIPVPQDNDFSFAVE
jgi:hypothetical protein